MLPGNRWEISDESGRLDRGDEIDLDLNGSMSFSRTEIIDASCRVPLSLRVKRSAGAGC